MDNINQLLQKTLHHEIPLTQTMGIEVQGVTHNSVTLTAPLENNINHKATAFGGSLYSVAVLAGWSMIFTRLESAGLEAHIVIQDSSIEYLRPVPSDIRAICRIESEELIQRFIKVFKRRGAARIILPVTVVADEGVAVSFEGRYAIHQ